MRPLKYLDSCFRRNDNLPMFRRNSNVSNQFGVMDFHGPATLFKNLRYSAVIRSSIYMPLYLLKKLLKF